MATLEKLIKSWEALKYLPSQISDEISMRRKEKIALCVTIADTFCSSSIKTGAVNVLLSFSVETLLHMCDDPDSDVRMTADESLNRIIRQAIMESHVMKIQVELHKEIKKNGSARRLRAALWRFAHLSYLIRPQKGKPYVNNLMPCLVNISKRTEEPLQETLASAMPRIFRALGVFTTDKDVKGLLKAFLQNLSVESAQIRRTAASCIVSICLYCRKPQVFFTYILNTLLDFVVPIRENQPIPEVLGVLGCLRAVLPHVASRNGDGVSQGELRGSFGVRRSHKEADPGTDRMLQVYELSIHFSKHTDHNVVNAALELLHQLLLSPPPEVLPVLLSPHGISRSRITPSVDDHGRLTLRSLSQMSVAGSLAPGDESTLLELDADLPSAMSAAVSAPLLERWIQEDTSSCNSDARQNQSSVTAGVMSMASLQLLDAADPTEPNLLAVPEHAHLVQTILEEGNSTDSSPGEISESVNCHLETDTQCPFEPRLEHKTPPTSAGGLSTCSVSPAPNQTEVKFQVCDIGSLTDGSIPLVYCARHLATSFLLTGYPSFCMPDRNVRVSVKALALNCIAAIVRLHPNVFQLYLDKDPISPARRASNSGGSSQALCEVLQFANHSDPQLRAVCHSLVAGLVKSVLVQSGGNWQSWQRKADRKVAQFLALPRLVQFLVQGLEDESSTTCRLTLSALLPCLLELLKSRDSLAVLPILQVLPSLTHNPYWLVKVKLLELVSELPFVMVHHVTSSSSFQDKVVHEMMIELLRDEDNRVRRAAADAVVRVIPRLFYPMDHSDRDPVAVVASGLSDVQLSQLLLDHRPEDQLFSNSSSQRLPNIDCLPPPLNLWNKHSFSRTQSQSLLEASLSRIVSVLSQLLLQSSSKHLTFGCCETLSALACEYPPTVYVQAWNCVSVSVSQNSSLRKDGRKETGENNTSSYSAASGLLGTVLCLLTGNPITMDLNCQQWLMLLAGNLFCGIAVCNLQSVEPMSWPQLWTMFKDVQMRNAAEVLLHHVVRTLNIVVHVLEDASPTNPSNKPGLPLPLAPALSPIKRHGSSSNKNSAIMVDASVDSKSGRGMSPIKNVIQAGDKEEKSEEKRGGKNAPFGAYANNPHYMRFHDLLRNACINHRMSLDAEANEKLIGVVQATLTVLSQLLEVMTFVEAGRLTEEVLVYLRVSMRLSPAPTVLCVTQLLKCVVGMNLVTFWKEEMNNHELEKGQVVPESIGTGFYNSCFQQPYQKLMQFLSKTAAKPTNVEVSHAAGWMSASRRWSDAKIGGGGGRSADKMFLASYIRLFEPMVIESLQQYTVTSDVQLQVRVLLLLTQLVQLHVNYCLLDSEMVFIGFVQKQFEYIEEGQILNAEELINRIFHFMVLLSLDTKHHTKSITTIPKVIQLCDGLMASGQNPLTHCIPALIPVVEHGFLSKISDGGAIDSEELETQREVIVAMLLRLVEYHQVMELLSLVLVECRNWPDGEERWRRWSHQVADAVFPLLAGGRVRLDSRAAQQALHRLLLHGVAPIVFRPIDSVLRVLFAPPPHVESSVQSVIRWLGTILAMLLVLVSQGKEDATLSRIEELEISLPALFSRGGTMDLASPDPLNVAKVATPRNTASPELTLARLVLRVIGFAGERVDSVVMDPASSPELISECKYLQELLAHFLLVCIHMFQSGSHCKMGGAAVELVAGHATEDSLLLEDANAIFLELAPACPLLMFLWCYLLTLLNYSNHAFWARVLPSPLHMSSKDRFEDSKSSHSINMEIVRTGATIVYCDFVCENPSETEQLSWLLLTHMPQIVELSTEPPVQVFIAALHRSPVHSGTMLQAIQNNCSNLNEASKVLRLLRCLEGIHPSHSGPLLLLIADRLLSHPHPALARRAAQLCARRAEYLLTLPPPLVAEQISREDLRDLLHSLHRIHLDWKHSGLVSILNKLGSQCLALSPLETDQARPISPTSVQMLQLDKDWYLGQVKLRCSQGVRASVAAEESALLLSHLELEDVVSVLSAPDTHLAVLQHCFRHGTHLTLQARGTNTTSGQQLEETLSPLYRAARLVLLQHVHHYTELVPKCHQVFLPVGRPMSEAEQVYSKKLCKVLSDGMEMNALFRVAAAVTCYVNSLDELCGTVPSEAAEDLAAFAILCLEAAHSLVQGDEVQVKKGERKEDINGKKRKKADEDSVETFLDAENSEQFKMRSKGKYSCLPAKAPKPSYLELGLKCASQVICAQSLGSVIEQPTRISWFASACSAVCAVLEFALQGEALPVIPKDGLSEALEDLESGSIAHACHQMATLVAWLERRQNDRAARNIPQFLQSPIHRLIVRLCRAPLINSFVWTPPDVWRHGWAVKLSGKFHTVVPPLPNEFLQEMDVLRQFIFRVTLLGWISRQQFEETWMSLLSVLSSDVGSDENLQEDLPIIAQANSVAIEAITALLLQTLLLPVPGDPNTGHFIHIPRGQPHQNLRDKCVEKLQAVQQMLMWKLEGVQGTPSYTVFNRANLERLHHPHKFSYGQMSVEYLQYSLLYTQGTAHQGNFSETVVTLHDQRVKALQASGLDLNSCLYFLLDLFTQWTQPQMAGISGGISQPLHEVLRSALAVSDLFTEHSQWQWLLQTSLELGRTQPLEDDILHQYIVLAQCKACAVLQPETEVFERVRRSVENALRSTFVPLVTAALHGLLYLLQSGLLSSSGFKSKDSSQEEISVSEDTLAAVTIATEHVQKLIASSTTSISLIEDASLVLWSLALFLLDNLKYWKVEALEEAVSPILQQALSLAHPSGRASPTLQRIIMHGLERLVVSESLSPRAREQITKFAVESLADTNPSVLVPALQLLLSCMYMEHREHIYVRSTSDSEAEVGNVMDPEQLVHTMEKISALFDRIKKGYPMEGELVCSVLPTLLTDFFPASEVLTKVIGEFLSQQQPHPRLLAGVVFQVLGCAVAQSQLSLLQDWVVLSLSNFTQTLPVPMATWCLTCFFISASRNPWLRALFPHVQSRIGRCEYEDRKLLCLAATDFYNQLTSQGQTSTFLKTLQVAVECQPNSPFAELIACLTTSC